MNDMAHLVTDLAADLHVIRCRCPGPGPCSECVKRAKAHATTTTINDEPQLRLALERLRFVGIQGKKGSGKSVIADYLLSQGFQRVKFATVLKDMLRVLLRRRRCPADLIERMLEGDLKEVASDYLNGKTPRWTMQSLGTEWGRERIHPNLWVDTEMDALPATGDFICDDVRFPNEAAAIHSVGGMLICVERPDLISEDEHVSEMHQLPADVILVNDGTVQELQEKAKRIVAACVGARFAA
jgi:hypothetical protein